MKSFKSFLNEDRTEPIQLQTAIEILSEYKNDPDVYISFTGIDKIGINPQSSFNTPNGIYTYPLKAAWSFYDIDKKGIQGFPFAKERPYIWIVRKSCNTFVDDIGKQYSKKDLERDLEKIRKIYGKQFRKKSERQINIENTKQKLRNVQTAISSINITGKNAANLDYYRDQIDLLNYVLDKWESSSEKEKIKKLQKKIDEILQYISRTNNAIKMGVKSDNPIIKNDIVLAQKKSVILYKKKLKQLHRRIERIVNDLSLRDESALDEIIKKASDSAKIPEDPPFVFWNVTRWLANDGVKPETVVNSKMTFKWNNILRKLGYCGFADKTGFGVIHPAEPVQAIFLDKKSFTVIKRIKNIESFIELDSFGKSYSLLSSYGIAWTKKNILVVNGKLVASPKTYLSGERANLRITGKVADIKNWRTIERLKSVGKTEFETLFDVAAGEWLAKKAPYDDSYVHSKEMFDLLQNNHDEDLTTHLMQYLLRHKAKLPKKVMDIIRHNEPLFMSKPNQRLYKKLIS